jgi:hypothetical protein
MRKILASVAVIKDTFGFYMTTVHWEDDFKAYKSEPGLNEFSRVPQLDTLSPEGIGYFITMILKGDPIGTLEFLWMTKEEREERWFE